jgi:DNA-binding SARP family transcriptional activator
MQDRISLQLFGRFTLSGGEDASELSGRKLRALLAYLALNNATPQPRERLMSLLWGSHFDTQSRQNLRQALSRLRRSIGDALVVTEDERLTIDTDLLVSDVSKFETLCTDGSREALSEADSIYAAEFLEGLSVPEPEWEDWLTAERNRLRGLALDARAKLASLLLEVSEIEQALEVANRGRADDPLREDLLGYAMLALAGMGRKAEALRSFDEFAVLLESELATTPDDETVRVRDQIRDGLVGKEIAPQSEPALSTEGEEAPAIPEPTPPAPATSEVAESKSTGSDILVREPQPVSHLVSVADAQLSQAETEVATPSPIGGEGWGRLRRWTPTSLAVVASAVVAVCGLLVWAATAYLNYKDPNRFGPNLKLLTSDQHAIALVGMRLDMRRTPDEPVSIWIEPGQKLRIELIRLSSPTQKIETDVGTWRSVNDQFCIDLIRYMGPERCFWIARDGITYTAFDNNDRSHHWVFRERNDAAKMILKPESHEVGKTVGAERLEKILPGSQLTFGYRGKAVTMDLVANGKVQIGILTRSPNGKQIETDQGAWRLDNDYLCIKPTWWQHGRESCFNLRAGPNAYAFIHKKFGVVPILMRK